jgi:predicted nucleic acid-binding protein
LKRFVLDCSVSAAWCLKDESSAAADRYLARLETAEAVVPPLWIAEMVNVLLVAERRRRITAEDARLALELLEQLPIVPEPPEPGSMTRVHELARRFGLSAYDACYLELALAGRWPLASLDRDLRAAARSAKVRLL